MSLSASALGATSLPSSRPIRGRIVGSALAAILVFGSVSSVLGAGSPRPVDAAGTLSLDAAGDYLEGIDVSHWQGTIDWTKVAAAAKRFAILKATDGKPATSGGGLFVDPTYATNHAAAKTAGLWTGAYHFARPDLTSGDAVREADHFADVINLGTGDLIPALDIEVSGGLSATALTAWVTAFLERVTARIGARPMIYTSPNFWKTSMADTRTLADAGYKTLWIAHWNAADPTVPAVNWGGHGWTFWQYSNCGSVAGIGGCVDLDRYRGLDLRLQAYSIFRLASSSSPVLKQGASSTTTVDIRRTNFTSGIALDVTGLPDGWTAEFGANPTTGSSAALVVRTPADPTATPLGAYPLTITGTADGITSSVAVSLVVVDGIAPTVAAPFTSLLSKTVLGTTSVPVRVAWSASDPSGIAAEGLQRSFNGGAWSTIKLATATATSATQSLPIGASTQQRARATDRLANTSAWRPGPVVRTLLTQQSATSITYSGTWRTASSKYASGGSVRYATSAGASATYRFTGSSVGWVAARGPSRGSARVYVDGVYAATINLSSASGQSRAIVFARNWQTTGVHTLRIVVVGTAGHPRVDIDAFVRLAIR